MLANASFMKNMQHISLARPFYLEDIMEVEMNK